MRRHAHGMAAFHWGPAPLQELKNSRPGKSNNGWGSKAEMQERRCGMLQRFNSQTVAMHAC